jgi:mono/diheme cytochrome c family protein
MIDRRLWLALLVLAAGGSGAAQAGPRTDYLLHCMGCHLADGSGAPPDIPALKGRVGYYLQIPEGRSYLMQVPGSANSPLTDAALAEVLNWILSEFAQASAPAQWAPFTGAEVARHRRDAPADVDAWRHALWRQIAERFPAGSDRY